MATITWRRGSPDPLVFQPVQPDGSLAPLDGLSMQLRVRVGGVCLIVDGVRRNTGTPRQDGFDLDLWALNDVPARAYVASEYYNDGSGWRWVSDHVLNIEGVC